MFSGQYTEEAFLLSSLHVVVKVWANCISQAKFDLNICDGVADLSLNFKLGHPKHQHCDPPNDPLQPDHDYHDDHCEDHDEQESFCPVPQPQRKSQARREQNRLRVTKE